MNQFLRTHTVFGMDLNVHITIKGSQAIGRFARPAEPPFEEPIVVNGLEIDDAVHAIMTRARHLEERAHHEYRNAHLRGWAAQLAMPVSVHGRASVFDSWLLEKLLSRCSRFQVSWTPVQDSPMVFRLLRDGSTVLAQVAPAGQETQAATISMPADSVSAILEAVSEFVLVHRTPHAGQEASRSLAS